MESNRGESWKGLHKIRLLPGQFPLCWADSVFRILVYFSYPPAEVYFSYPSAESIFKG